MKRLAYLLFLFPLGSMACRCPPAELPATPIFAGVTIRCGNSQYTLTTGNKGGKCQTTVDGGGKTTGGTCLDLDGNSAHATCDANGGEGRCVTAAGSGECRQTARTASSDLTEPPPGDVQPSVP